MSRAVGAATGAVCEAEAADSECAREAPLLAAARALARGDDAAAAALVPALSQAELHADLGAEGDTLLGRALFGAAPGLGPQCGTLRALAAREDLEGWWTVPPESAKAAVTEANGEPQQVLARAVRTATGAFALAAGLVALMAAMTGDTSRADELQLAITGSASAFSAFERRVRKESGRAAAARSASREVLVGLGLPAAVFDAVLAPYMLPAAPRALAALPAPVDPSPAGGAAGDPD